MHTYVLWFRGLMNLSEPRHDDLQNPFSIQRHKKYRFAVYLPATVFVKYFCSKLTRLM